MTAATTRCARVALVVAALAGASTAHADEAPTVVRRHGLDAEHLRVGIAVGKNLPMGNAAGVEWRFSPRLSAHAGLGGGYSGVRYGVGVRARTLDRGYRLSLGAGISDGRYADDWFTSPHREYDRVTRIDADVRIQFPFARRGVLAFIAGAGAPVITSGCERKSGWSFKGEPTASFATPCSEPLGVAPYFGMSFSAAFDL